MERAHEGTGLAAAANRVGEQDALDLLSALVSIAPTNLEDPLNHRYEKPNYPRALERVVRAAREAGLSTTVYDPVLQGADHEHLGNVPRPNAIIDLEVGAPERVLILAHYDVVPVPAEQRPRWKSPPHTLTLRPDGRLYGRGSNDDLGSGVVPSILAMRRLVETGRAPRNVRLLVCCDEETGGEGGIESLKAHDDALPENDPRRFLLGEVALIPDGSPHTTAASSGVAFLDASFRRPVPLAAVLAYGEELVRLHDLARTWVSKYPSPDWPDHGAPAPTLTGRATVTKFDVSAGPRAGSRPRLHAAHAESDAANQIAESVTLVFSGPPPELEELERRLTSAVRAPFRLSRAGASALVPPPGALAVQVVGQSAHGGYPHRGHNPVPASFELLRRAADEQWIASDGDLVATFAVDLRLIPEVALAPPLEAALDRVRRWAQVHSPEAVLEAPPARCRPGYSIPSGSGDLERLQRILAAEGGEAGIFGEYGGTDASSLASVRTPSGAPLPAIVFGSMDRASHIHEAEESIDPALMGTMVRTLYRFLSEP